MKRLLTVCILAAALAGAATALDVDEQVDEQEALSIVIDSPEMELVLPEPDVFYAQAAPEPPTPPVPPGVTILVDKGSYLGVGVQEIDAGRGKDLKLSDVHGVELTRVEEDSPAEKAGLKAGDVVLEYNGQRVEGVRQFQRFVQETPPERQVKLLISRNGATQTVSAAIGSRKHRGVKVISDRRWQAEMDRLQRELGRMRLRMPDMPQTHVSWRSGVMGVEAESLGSQLATFFGVKQGVLVRSVGKDTPAEKAGVQAGDVITKVDGQEVSTPSEISQRIRALDEKKSFALTLVRNKSEVTANVTIEPADRGEGRPRRIITTPRTRGTVRHLVMVHSLGN